jgi:hypothetical protein
VVRQDLLAAGWLPTALDASHCFVARPRNSLRRSERLDAGLKVHSSRLPDEHIVRRDGLRVTTVARTAVDLALGGDLPSALVAADSALRHLVLDVVPRETGSCARARCLTR